MVSMRLLELQVAGSIPTTTNSERNQQRRKCNA